MTWYTLESSDLPPRFAPPRDLPDAADAAAWASVDGAAAVWVFRGGRWARMRSQPQVGAAVSWWYFWGREQAGDQVSQGWMSEPMTSAEALSDARSLAASVDNLGNGYVNFFICRYDEATRRFAPWLRVK